MRQLGENLRGGNRFLRTFRENAQPINTVKSHSQGINHVLQQLLKGVGIGEDRKERKEMMEAVQAAMVADPTTITESMPASSFSGDEEGGEGDETEITSTNPNQRSLTERLTAAGAGMSNNSRMQDFQRGLIPHRLQADLAKRNLDETRAHQAGLLKTSRAREDAQLADKRNHAALVTAAANSRADALLRDKIKRADDLLAAGKVHEANLLKAEITRDEAAKTLAFNRSVSLKAAPAAPKTAMTPDVLKQQMLLRAAGRPTNIGSIPSGMQMITGLDGTVRLTPIPGSKAAAAATNAAAASDQAAKTAVDKASVMLSTVANIRKELKEALLPASGTLSVPGSKLSLTSAGRVRSHIRTLQSGQVLQTMLELKKASSTGATGFGALSQKELDILIAEIGALDPDITEPDILLDTMQRIEDRYIRIMSDAKRDMTPEKITELGLDDLIKAADNAVAKKKRTADKAKKKFGRRKLGETIAEWRARTGG